jgi:hypothetical protein
MAPKKASAVKKNLKQPALPKAKSTKIPKTTTKKKPRKQGVDNPTSDDSAMEDSGGEVEVLDKTPADAVDADVE